jgi:hypothetical protein
VRPHEVGLELLKLFFRDVDPGKQPEAGIDPVGRLSCGDDRCDRARRRIHRKLARGRQRDWGEPGCDRPQLGQRELPGRQRQHQGVIR